MSHFIRRIFSISSKVRARFFQTGDFCAAWSSPVLFYSATTLSSLLVVILFDPERGNAIVYI